MVSFIFGVINTVLRYSYGCNTLVPRLILYHPLCCIMTSLTHPCSLQPPPAQWWTLLVPIRYSEDLDLEDAIHTALLTLKVDSFLFFLFFSCPYFFFKKKKKKKLQEGFEGQMTENNIELGIVNASGFRRLEVSEVKDYLTSIVA